jgi:hypothetical protein
MLIHYIFKRKDVTPRTVAKAARVALGTVYRWKDGSRHVQWPEIARLFNKGILTPDDLRRGGMKLPPLDSEVQAK